MQRAKKTTKEKHIGQYWRDAKRRALRDSVPFSITKQYLMSIAGEECPVFHTPFEWGRSGLGVGKQKPNGPQLDRIEPELGYVEGNVAFLSQKANRMKDSGTMQDHYDIADWIWSHLYAKPNTTPPVPKRTNLKGIDNSQLRTDVGSGIGEDNYYSYHYSGTISGENPDHSTQASSGNSMGLGSKEVGTSKIIESLENYGQPRPTYDWLEY